MNLKLVENSDHKYVYGVLCIGNPKISEKEVQDKIYEFKNSYKAYGYDSVKEIKDEGYSSVDEMMANESPCWMVEDLAEKAFPKSWKLSFIKIDGRVEC